MTRIAYILLGALLPVAVSRGAVGEVVDAPDTVRTRQLQEVEVTSSRQQQAARSSAPVHLIDHDLMLRMGVVDMADALQRLPGITLRDYGGAGGLKTVSVRGFGASHTGVSYDGVVLSECQSGEIDLSRYSLDHVDQVALHIGEGDDLFVPARQAATPAVLAIETMRPTDARRLPAAFQAQARVGSFGHVSPFLRYDQSLSPRLQLCALGEYTYAENDYPFTLHNVTLTTEERRTNSRMNQGHAELNLHYLLGEGSSLTAKAYYYDNDRQLPGQVQYYSNLSRESLRDRNAFAQVQYVGRWDGRWALKVIGKQNWASSSYRDPLYPGGVRDADYWQRETYAAACLLFTPTEQWAMDYSADYAMNSLNSSLASDVRPRRHTVLQSLAGKYETGRLRLTGRLLHSLYLNDVRRNEHAHNESRLSPSVSLSYQPLPSQRLYLRASYKNIFRSPTFNESYFFHYGSTDLRPESTDQLNVGVTYATPPSQSTELRLSLDAYENHIKDKIVAVPYNMFIWTCINVGKVRMRGLDATMAARHQWSDRQSLLFTANFSLQRVQNRTNPESPYYGLQLAYMPEHQGAASLSWDNPWVNVVLHMHAVSKRWGTNEHHNETAIDGYSEWGLSLRRQWQAGTHRLSLRLDLRNLLDRQYEIVSHYPMPGRNYQFTILYQH
ncbi:MAG: TonB-dependent receptor plug domain-containing protein [Prevotella sp.]|jgi:outer membrane cobalamin receptor